MGFKSDSTGKNYKKVEKMWNSFSDDTGGFTKLNNMDNNDIGGAIGTHLVTSLNIFSTWMLIQSKTVLYGRNRICSGPEFMPKTIGKFCVMF